jgi:hypothetical protein
MERPIGRQILSAFDAPAVAPLRPHERNVMIIKMLQKELNAAESLNAVSKATGVSYPIVHRLANGQDCYASKAETLLQYFGYKLVKKPAKKRSPKRSK